MADAIRARSDAVRMPACVAPDDIRHRGYATGSPRIRGPALTCTDILARRGSRVAGLRYWGGLAESVNRLMGSTFRRVRRLA